MEPITQPIQNAASSLPIMTVGELTTLVKGTLRSAPRLRDVWVEGEVGQVSISAAGHCYFTLKDDRAQLRCVIFRDERLMMPFEARTGLAAGRPRPPRRVRATGHLPALRREPPAVRLRRSGAAIRGAEGQAGGRGTVRIGAQAAAARVSADDRRGHQPVGRRVARHTARPGAALAIGASRGQRLPGAGHWRGARRSSLRCDACRAGRTTRPAAPRTS